MESVIYQPSDLAGNKRTAFIDEARAGRAHLRHKDGTSLVMLPASDLDVLERFAHWSRLSRRLGVLLRHNDAPTLDELGELGWLRVFDHEDIQSFLDDLELALVAALADNSTEMIESTIHDWRITARQLEDPLRRSILLGRHDIGEFEEVDEPSPE